MKLVFMGILPGQFLGAAEAGNTKRPNVAFEKVHAASAVEKVMEPESGRTVQRQMNNLLIGVVPRPSRIATATSVRFGARGTKLTHGLNSHHWLAGLQLPFRFNAKRAQTWESAQARKFLLDAGPPAGGWGANQALQRL